MRLDELASNYSISVLVGKHSIQAKKQVWDNDDDEVYLTVYVCKGCGYEWTAIADVRPLLEDDDP